MKLLAFAASNHSASINRELLGYATDRLVALMPAIEVEFIDINDYEMPIYSIDREKADGIHPLAKDFYTRIGAADALLVSFAEYNGFVTAAWKNIFDWMSRIDIKVWQDKPAIYLAATPGRRAGAGVLSSQEKLAPFFGADLVGMQGFGNWAEAWDADAKSLVQAEDRAALDNVLNALITRSAAVLTVT